MSNVKVTFVGKGPEGSTQNKASTGNAQSPLRMEVEAELGETLLDTALRNEVPIQHACGGYCACTTCHINVRDGGSALSPMESDEEDRLEKNGLLTPGSRLACQAKVMGSLIVEIQNEEN